MPELNLSDPLVFGLVALVAVFAGFVRGLTGFGGPAVMILSLVPFFAPVSVLTKVVLIDIVSNVRLLPATLPDVSRPLMTVFVIGSFAGAPFGVYALDVVDPEIMKRLIALVAGVCTVAMLAGWRARVMPPAYVTAAVGVCAGVVLGASMIAFLAIVYFMCLPIRAAETRANMVLWGFVLGALFVPIHIALGWTVWADIWRCLLLGLIYLATTFLGDRVFRRLSERNFRQFVLWFLLVLSGAGLVA
ncbi:MAG: sulfite exporter TauE/SafE family protein [Gammaproteobacteria bacterium]|nr:sulfite exporter TauE/SafE family protein [Gammaproteobacteria bacterium]